MHQAQEHLESRYRLFAAGMDIEGVAKRVGEVLNVDAAPCGKRGSVQVL